MGLTLATVLGALPTLMSLVGKGGGVSSLIHEIVGSFDSKPADQAKLRAEIDKLANDNDTGHQRLQAKLMAASQR